MQVATCQNTAIATVDSCSLSMRYVLRVVLSVSHVLGLFFLFPTTARGRYYYHIHCAGEETEAQRG